MHREFENFRLRNTLYTRDLAMVSGILFDQGILGSLGT